MRAPPKKNTKSEIITYQPKTFENPNIADKKSITEHPKTLQKLYKTIRKAEKVGSENKAEHIVIDHTISISKYKPLAGSSYIKLSKELDHPRKGLINIKNIDNNECFK